MGLICRLIWVVNIQILVIGVSLILIVLFNSDGPGIRPDNPEIKKPDMVTESPV